MENETGNLSFAPSNVSLMQEQPYSDPEVLTLLAMGSVGFILNISVISIATRRPVFDQVPIKALVASLGSANLFTIAICMILNAAWHSFGEMLFGTDCRLYKTLEAFSLGATAYVVVIWTIDRCRDINLGNVEKGGLDLPIQKPRHLSKLVLAAWTLAVLLAFQHVIVIPEEPDPIFPVEKLPTTMTCVSRGRFQPPWKKTVVDLVAIGTVFLLPMLFIIGCLAALLVDCLRRLRKKDRSIPLGRPNLPLRRFHSYEVDSLHDSHYIEILAAVLSFEFMLLWGPYYVTLIIRTSGLYRIDSFIVCILYIIGLSFALFSPITYLVFHLWKTCRTDQFSLGRTPSSVRERIEMLQRNQLSRRFDDL